MKAKDLINILQNHPDAEIKLAPHYAITLKNFDKRKTYHKLNAQKVTACSYYAPIENTIFFYYN